MSHNVSRPWLKVLSLFLIIGLITHLLMKMKNRNKQSLNRSVIAHSEYGSYADFVIAQAQHESANFTSAVYRKNNNPFGMKVPSQRNFLGTVGSKAPDGGYYAYYENDTIAFKDFLKWLRARAFPIGLETIEDYVSAMRSKGYFTDSEKNYLAGVRRYLKKN